MDIRFFLLERLRFIRQLYDTTSQPYAARKRLIESEEEPFKPTYSEDGDPQFDGEWIEADESLQVLGATCVSLLSAALNLYLNEWQKRIGAPADVSAKAAFKKSWVQGYKSYLEANTTLDFASCPSDFSILEELVLARNQAQHPSFLALNQVHYSLHDLQKMSSPLFMSEHDTAKHAKGEKWDFIPPTIRVTGEALFAAIDEVEKLAEWMESSEVRLRNTTSKNREM